jgi:hypothetical protein
VGANARVYALRVCVSGHLRSHECRCRCGIRRPKLLLHLQVEDRVDAEVNQSDLEADSVHDDIKVNWWVTAL